MSKDKKVVREHIVIDNKKLEKLRRQLSKTIDDFKLSVLESLESSSEGPLKEGLRVLDLPVAASLLVDPLIAEHSQVAEDITLEASVVRPVIIQQTKVISSQELQDWVADEKLANVNLPQSIDKKIDYAPYADVTEKVQTVIHTRGAHVFFAGFDNLVNSNVRNFLQRRGARTFLPALEGQATKSIIEQFQFYNDIEFAVVVLSPDEFMFQKVQDPKNAMLVASQKVVYELGYLVGKLGRNRVVVFYEEVEGFKRPTEYFDLSYIPFDVQGHWQQRLIGQMRVGGILFSEEKQVAV